MKKQLCEVCLKRNNICRCNKNNHEHITSSSKAIEAIMNWYSKLNYTDVDIPDDCMSDLFILAKHIYESGHHNGYGDCIKEKNKELIVWQNDINIASSRTCQIGIKSCIKNHGDKE